MPLFIKKKKKRSSFTVKPLQLDTVKTYPYSTKNKNIKCDFSIYKFVTIQKPMSDLKAGKMAEKSIYHLH